MALDLGWSGFKPDCMNTPPPAARPSFGEALRFWLKLGFISFGGPAGQIAIMHEELVERKRWIGENRFLHALNFCMLLPGPEATQLATYCGWLLHRTWGGIAAGVLFILPSALLLWMLSYVYVVHGQVGWLAAAFYGIKPAVAAIVAAAVIRMGRKALRRRVHWLLAALAFGALFFLKVPFPAVVGGALAVGFVGARLRPEVWAESRPGQTGGAGAPEDRSDADLSEAGRGRTSLWRTSKVALVCLVLWWAPVLAAAWWQGWEGTPARLGVFFSQAAMVTFGGAYAVLPYVGQQAVDHHGWLTASQMLDGLGLAETTPGPLIMVVQFVGFLGGWSQPGGLSPLQAATLGAGITTWTTFVPCFLWIFVAAPYLERLRENALLSGALAAVTAAVVGVVLNLAVWFGAQVFHPRAGVIDGFAIGLAAAAFLTLQRWKGGTI
ncbi:MAG: chromate efflux transporter, partial [Opitutaceae bacterium]|nr:chromate efflux transporter [Opitutaceae bacterium]